MTRYKWSTIRIMSNCNCNSSCDNYNGHSNDNHRGSKSKSDHSSHDTDDTFDNRISSKERTSQQQQHNRQ